MEKRALRRATKAFADGKKKPTSVRTHKRTLPEELPNDLEMTVHAADEILRVPFEPQEGIRGETGSGGARRGGTGRNGQATISPTQTWHRKQRQRAARP